MQEWKVEGGLVKDKPRFPWRGFMLDEGRHFFGKEEVKRVIEVIPEIDMTGHFQAALAAYPEFSCTPNAKHEVWTDYSVSTDVLNVANPASMEFVKDILDELADLFPFEYFHIGGDECPTVAWQNNEQCQQLLASMGSTNYHDLQTWFFKEIENHLKTEKTEKTQKIERDLLHGMRHCLEI